MKKFQLPASQNLGLFKDSCSLLPQWNIAEGLGLRGAPSKLVFKILIVYVCMYVYVHTNETFIYIYTHIPTQGVIETCQGSTKLVLTI